MACLMLLIFCLRGGGGDRGGEGGGGGGGRRGRSSRSVTAGKGMQQWQQKGAGFPTSSFCPKGLALLL